MASTAITSQPLANTSYSRQNHLNQQHQRSFSAASANEELSSQDTLQNPHMSFNMSQGSQNGLMMQPGSSFRQYDQNNGHHRNPPPQIYSAVYSGVDVYEMEVNNIAVMRRRKDSWLNATQILKVAGIEKGKRTKVLEKEILIGEHEKVQGGYGKYQGTWINFERGQQFCRQYQVEDLLRPLLTYDMGHNGGIPGRGGVDTPTKEQAMAANRKRLYNANQESRANSQSGTFFKNISSTASTAVAAISKARFDSPAPRNRNGSAMGRPSSFSRQSSHNLASQENAFPGGSQQSIQSFASEASFAMNGQDSAYATQSGPQFSHTVEGRNGDFEEPPRKRIRTSPSVSGSQQQPIADEYYSMSMREPSPTEANESFLYHNDQEMVRNEEYPTHPMTLPPLPSSHSSSNQNKKSLLMSLFMDSNRSIDFSKHEAFQTLTLQDLEMPVDQSLNTALSWAATLARVPLLKTFVAKGASICRVNRSGETALMRACVVTNNMESNTFPEILELLGPTIELRDVRGRTVLHHIALTSAVKGRSQATNYYLVSLLKFIVQQGSAPNSQPFNNGAPVLTSMGIGRFMSEIVNIQDKSGDTALNIAARIGNRSIISQLLEVGADPTIQNRSNLCPVDFGIGDPADRESRIAAGFQSPEKSMMKDTKESSSDIINSLTALLTSTTNEFHVEMNAKQAQIDTIHAKLREASATVGIERARLDELKRQAKERDELKLKLANLRRAEEEERNRLVEMKRTYGQPNEENPMRLGDADKGLAIALDSFPPTILANINPNPYSEPNLDSAQRQLLSSLPPTHILRARVSAYKANNDGLQESIRSLKSKNSELAGKYRKIISICTNVPEAEVDGVLHNLLRAVDSEQNDVELGRVREFLQRVDGA